MVCLLFYRADEAELPDSLAAAPGEPAISAKISIEQLFMHLPPAQVRAIELVKIEGRSVTEAAKACGQSESLVKVNIHRGLKRLAAIIEKA